MKKTSFITANSRKQFFHHHSSVSYFFKKVYVFASNTNILLLIVITTNSSIYLDFSFGDIIINAIEKAEHLQKCTHSCKNVRLR